MLAIVLSNSTISQIKFNTGSIEFDNNLKKINTEASVNFGSFKTDLALSYNTSTKKIDYMKASVKMKPAEIYLAFEISKISKKSIDEIITIYKTNKNKGWGYIAKQAGIKPGSAEFHALKGKTKNKSNKKGKGKGNKKNKNKNKNKKHPKNKKKYMKAILFLWKIATNCIIIMNKS